MQRYFLTADKAEFDQALKTALTDAGFVLPEDLEVPARGNFNQRFTDESGEQPVIVKINVDWFHTSPFATDEDGNFIVESTDEDGVDTYQLAPGYHVNLADPFGLTFPESIEIFPGKPQAKFM